MNIKRDKKILHTIYNIKYNEYVGWLVCYRTFVIGSIEVSLFGARVGVVGDPAAVGVAAIAFFQKSFFDVLFWRSCFWGF